MLMNKKIQDRDSDRALLTLGDRPFLDFEASILVTFVGPALLD